MPPIIDPAALDRLIARGRARPGVDLNADDLRTELPVGTMSVDDLVLIILELEDAGVGVEPDVLGPRATAMETNLRLPATPPGAVLHAGRTPAQGTVAVAPDAPPAAPPEPAHRTAPVEEARRTDRVVALAGLVTFLVLSAVVLML